MAVTVNNINPSRSTVFTIRGNNNDTYQLTADYIYQAKGPCILYQWYTDGYIVGILPSIPETCYTANREYLTTISLDNVIAINADFGGTNRTFVYNGTSFVSWGKFTPSMYQKGGQYYRAISSQASDPDQYLLLYDIDPIYFNREIIPPAYNWQSVTSLKGINDFSISLPVLSNINDGNPVSDASSSAFTKAPSAENNIKNLVDITLDPVATDNSATIFYTIPALKNDSYSSVKVYAKIGEVPKCDETDDIVEDIDPTINEISLENLEFETEYFFCIQSISNNGLKLSSNVESITTGNPIPAEYRQYINLINGCNGEGWDFFWRDYTINFPYGGYTDPKSFSYYNMRDSHYVVYNIVPEAFRSGYDDGYRYYTSHTTKFSLWIVNDNGTYKLYFRDYVPFIVGVNCSSFASDRGLYSSGRYSQDGGQYYFQWYANSGRLVFPTGDDTIQNSSNSLLSLIEWCSKTFRNVNIYVDGVLWSKANNAN